MARHHYHQTERERFQQLERLVALTPSTKPSWAERCGRHGVTPDYNCGACKVLINRWTPIGRPDVFRLPGAGGFKIHLTYDEEERIRYTGYKRELEDNREDYELGYQHMGHREKHPLPPRPKPPPPPDYAGGQTCLVCGRFHVTFCKTCADVVNSEYIDRRRGLAAD